MKFFKILPPSIPIVFPRTTINNRNRFHEKKTLMKLPYSSVISRVFHVFPNSPYLSRILFCKKCEKRYEIPFQTFFQFSWKSPDIIHISKKFQYTIAILKYMSYLNFMKNVPFWSNSIGLSLLKTYDFSLFLKKIDRDNPIENV